MIESDNLFFTSTWDFSSDVNTNFPGTLDFGTDADAEPKLWYRRGHRAKSLDKTLDFGTDADDFGTDLDTKSLGLWYRLGHQILRNPGLVRLGSRMSLDKVSVRVSLNMKRFWDGSTISFSSDFRYAWMGGMGLRLRHGYQIP
ncbi:unnamed protein product [Rhizophagus irregularis]|nr:unnamed protein product [Rhizophagus irregularis]